MVTEADQMVAIMSLEQVYQRQHPTDPYSAYVKHRNPTNGDHLGPTQDHPFAKHCSTIPELFARVVDKYSDK